MIVQKTIPAPSGAFQVYQCTVSPGTTTINKTLFTLQPGTVITCEESDILKGTGEFLRAFALFLIAQVPAGSPPLPANTYFYSTGAHGVTPLTNVTSGSTSNYAGYAAAATPPPSPYACKLVSVTGNGPVIIGTAGIVGGTQIVANTSSVVPDTGSGASYKLKGSSIFLMNGGTQGPYVFTDHDIPLNMLEDE
ncbi:MAG: hypothetical protein EHM43_12825 [Ignavibacteriae bacterium]|nr:MAG: hypothetical protein EHM43_12825 [Ignavibacteriota bacterium]